MGLGLLGRGVGDVRFLAEQGAILTVTDLKTESELKESLDKLKHIQGIEYVLGEHRLEDFRNRDVVLKSAGVPFDSPFIAEARKNNISVKMSTSLFAEFFLGTIVGITGTRGKSTVSAMVYEILKSSGKKTFLGGNTKGVSTLAHITEASEDEIVVLELDSWQLQGFGEEKLSPHISVFTTFYPDHLNYYKKNLDLYLADKANIFKYQQPTTNNQQPVLILGEQVVNLIQEKYPEYAKRAIIAKLDNLPRNLKLKVPGEHNRYNAACAAAAARALGIDEETIKKGLESFIGLEGRLELIREIKGVKIYNDTTSTTPNATVAALKALGSGGQLGARKNIILIFGGNDKGLDITPPPFYQSYFKYGSGTIEKKVGGFTELLELLSRFCKAVFVIPGTGSDLLPLNVSELELKRVENLEEAVSQSINIANSGDIILFSPAFTSFGQFRNEYDRGDSFMGLVNNL